jgi:hypothetical protein
VNIRTRAKDYTSLHNEVLRNMFRAPDGTRIMLRGLEHSVLVRLLSFHSARAEDPLWRLDVNEFAKDFAETRTTVYASLDRLETLGFLRRPRMRRPNGTFEWGSWDVTDQPGVFSQVAASSRKTGNGLAPPVDNPRSRRSRPVPGKPDTENPDTVFPATDTLYRETFKEELPASPLYQPPRELAEEAAGSRPEQPTLSLVRPAVPSIGEGDIAAEPDWVAWVNGLLDHPAVIAARPLRPSLLDLERVAVRAQVACDQFEWTRHDLATRVLLVGLPGVLYLGSVWAKRLHPANLGPPPEVGKKTLVEQGREAPEVERPSAARRAQIRAQAGQARGRRWDLRMGGST